MIEQARNSGENPAGQGPEAHNSEQDDEQWQSQTVAEEALRGEGRRASPLDSVKSDEPGEIMDDASQDLIDKMRDMEQSGRIDMGAFRGEPNHDDNQDWLDEENKLDDVPGDGAKIGNALGDNE